VKSRASRRFWQSYHELPAPIREAADKQFALWRENPRHRSLRFKRIRDSLWSARVTDDFRALATPDGDTWLWASFTMCGPSGASASAVRGHSGSLGASVEWHSLKGEIG
jgi:hypothetical protein